MQSIYLDNSATTPMHPEVADAIDACQRAQLANPASQHAAGRRARRTIEEAREAIAAMLGAATSGTHSDRLIFTSGGTESNNLAIRGLVGPSRAGATLVVSAIEHPSVLSAARQLAESGFTLRYWPVSGQGIVELEPAEDLLAGDVRLVSVMLGNHETGVLQPVAAIAGPCRTRGVLVHSDAVQAVGKIPVHFRQMGLDALTFSAHKFHGPVGIGGLLLRHHVQPVPLLLGGFQQGGMRPGTEPVALAVGMMTALKLALRDQDRCRDAMIGRRDRLAAALGANCAPIVIHGAQVSRLPHLLNVAFPGVDRQALVMALDLAGVACSTGSACASGSSEPSPVLTAMGLDTRLILSSIRLSLSALTTDSEVDEAARRISKVVNNLQRRIPA